MPSPTTIRVSVAGRTVVIPAASLAWQFARSSGPGGQHVNRTSSKAVLRFDVRHSPHLPDDVRRRMLRAVGPRLTTDGGILITSQRHRERGRNMADCRTKLVELLARCLVPPPVRRPTRRPKAAIERRLVAKKHRGRTKEMRKSPDD